MQRPQRVRWQISAACVLILIMPAQLDSSRWWRSPRFVAALKLRPSQATAINRLYEESIPDCANRNRAARAAHVRLNRLVDTNSADDDVERALIEAIDADAEVNKARTLLLVRMYRVLTSRQRAEVQRIGRLHSTRDAGRTTVEMARVEIRR